MQFRKNTRDAFLWLLPLIQKHHIPYQITGGFAAKIYGAKRPLIDIDIDIPEEKFAELEKELRPFVIYGPCMWKGEGFKVYIMTLNYRGQLIDIGGSHLTKIWHKKRHAWVPCKTQLTHYTWKYLFHHRIKVIPKDELVRYKEALHRRVDAKDLHDLL